MGWAVSDAPLAGGDAAAPGRPLRNQVSTTLYIHFQGCQTKMIKSIRIKILLIFADLMSLDSIPCNAGRMAKPVRQGLAGSATKDVVYGKTRQPAGFTKNIRRAAGKTIDSNGCRSGANDENQTDRPLQEVCLSASGLLPTFGRRFHAADAGRYPQPEDSCPHRRTPPSTWCQPPPA